MIWGRNPVSGALCVYCDTAARSSVTPIDCIRFGGVSTSALIRAAESIAFNIVEGCGSTSQKELARFLDISIKSASELEYQLMLARDYGVLGESVWKALSEGTTDIRRMLCGLRAKVLESVQPERINHGAQ